MVNHKLIDNLECYIKGWKSLANHYGIHIRTLQRWHDRLPIPWEKLGKAKGSIGGNASVRIHYLVAEAYYKIHR